MQNAERTPQFIGLPLPEQPSIGDVRAVSLDYVAILVSVMSYIADRYDRSPFPGLIDTKFSVVTGENFRADDPRGPMTVYGWIQGRALEALVGHAEWIRDHPWAEPTDTLLPRLERMIREIYATVQAMRARNNGRLFFFMDPNGAPFVFDGANRRVPYDIGPNDPYNFSDLFGSRGLFAAATFLGDQDGIDRTYAYCLAFEDALWQDDFASDQQKLPPVDEAAQPSDGRRSHAPFTILLPTPVLMALRYNDPSCIRRGLQMVQHVLDRHLNELGKIRSLDRYDFWEYVTDDAQPYIMDGQLLQDPGHTLEFVGLGLKLIRAGRRLGMCEAELGPYQAPMLSILERSFANGYVPSVGGIRKSVDLLTRQPIDDTMPWWSLPETMRAAMFSWAGTPHVAEKQRALQIFSACHNSFVTHYIRPDRHLFAVQTRSATGEIVNVVPATADADPGYHTGLSLIDVLHVVEEETGPLCMV